MVKLTVIYKKPPDPKSFDEYYRNKHVPTALAIPGLRRFDVSYATGTPMGGESPYYMFAELYFDNAEALKAGLSSPEGRASAKDVVNFAKENPPEMVVCEVDEKVLAHVN
jgi:uncharacterized protein (TIGR02118 family)